MIAAFVLSTAMIAAAPLDPRHTAMLTVLSRGEDAAGCNPIQRFEAAANATFRHLGKLRRSEVVLANVQAQCICGAQNCPYYVLRLDRNGPQVLYSTIGVTAKVVPAKPLPKLIFDAHDSAMVTDEMTAEFRKGRYVATKVFRVRGDTNARKPDSVPVKFPAGASSIALHGNAAAGWYDSYTFDAKAGQRLIVDGLSSPVSVGVTLFGPGDTLVHVTPGTAVTLPKTGTYYLHVEPASTDDQRYALTLAIR